MDPDATWAIIVDPSATASERDMAALDMLVWLLRDGFTPAASTREGAIAVCRQRLVESIEDAGE